MANASSPYGKERKLFISATEALKKKQYSKFKTLEGKLVYYPLSPYLEYYALRDNLNKAKPTEVEAFLKKYNDTPIQNWLSRRWLSLLASRQQWESFLAFYKDTNNQSLKCHHLWAKIQVNETHHYDDAIKDIWLSAKSQPKACDKLFRYWEKRGGITEQVAWKRIQLAYEKRNHGLMSYLTRYIPKSRHHLIQLAKNVDRNPSLVINTKLFSHTHPFELNIIVHGMKRLANLKLDKAKILWPKITKKYPLSSSQRAEIIQEIAMKLAIRNKEDAAKWLSIVPESHVNHTVRQWRIRNALLDLNWPSVMHWIKLLPEKEQEDRQWRYWQARALEVIGHTKAANEIYVALSDEPDYYGLLSAEHVLEPYALEHKPPIVSKRLINRIANMPGIIRAKELYILEKYIEARAEWYYAIKNMSKAEKRAATVLADNWGWHDRAIYTAARADLMDALNVRFPLANQDTIIQEAKTRDIDPAWTFAIARQESMFIQDAKSYMGAMGLMQIMPGTANMIAKDFQLKYRNKKDLLKPRTNIRFGTAYLKQMYDLYAENPVLATAAYNAGPHRVAEWLPEDRNLPADIWIDTIPFYETRDYLKKVLTYTVFYEYHLGREPKITRRMKMIALKDVIIKKR